MRGRKRAPSRPTETVSSWPLGCLFALSHLLAAALRLCCVSDWQHDTHQLSLLLNMRFTVWILKILGCGRSVCLFLLPPLFPHPLPAVLLKVVLEGSLLPVTAQFLKQQWLTTVTPETWNYFYFLKNLDKLIFFYMWTDNPCYSFKIYVIQLMRGEGESEGKGCILLENGKYCIYHLKKNKKICKLCGFLWQ